MSIIAAPEGVERVQAATTRTWISTSPAWTRSLNDHGYIVPGLGDAGDRIFGTK